MKERRKKMKKDLIKGWAKKERKKREPEKIEKTAEINFIRINEEHVILTYTTVFIRHSICKYNHQSVIMQTTDTNMKKSEANQSSSKG